MDQEEEVVLAEQEKTFAKLRRLRKQKRSLEERIKTAVSRELRDISELEQEESSSAPPSAAAAVSSVDPLASTGDCFLDPSWVTSSSDDLFAGIDLSAGFPLVDPGSAGGTPEVSQGSGGS